ncbi:MAG: hypothetical protein ACJA09_000942 [Alcanivorax sp.]
MLFKLLGVPEKDVKQLNMLAESDFTRVSAVQGGRRSCGLWVEWEQVRLKRLATRANGHQCLS